MFTLIELLLIKSATISKTELSKYKDKDGLIPVPRTFTRYNVKEYYEQYYRIAFVTIYFNNFILIIAVIKVLFFENIEKYYSTSSTSVLMIVFGLLNVTYFFFFSLIIRLLVGIKNKGIEVTKKKLIGFENFIINKYILFVQCISKTDDIKIANNNLWLQFFINKFLTILLITLLFFIKIVLLKCIIVN